VVFVLEPLRLLAVVFILELLLILLQKPEFQIPSYSKITYNYNSHTSTIQSQITYKHIHKFTYKHIQAQFTVTINIDIAIYNYIMFMHCAYQVQLFTHKFNI
jgi:hypothetical protein